jgi:site-specific DNA-methyltransferase (adenine-specific)
MPHTQKTNPTPPPRSWEVVHGDCLAVLDRPVGFAHLCVCDPPYNINQAYDAYLDNKPCEEYLAWTADWLAAVRHALHPHGSFWVFIPDEWVSEIDVLAKARFQFVKRRHVVWAFTFGQANQKNFSRSHCHLLYYTAQKTNFHFDAEAARVPSARQAVYGDKRARSGGKQPDDTWMLLKEQLEPYMTPDKDVWLENRICGTYKERRAHSPNQVPLPVMDRIVRTTSRPGDTVLDLFAGTGSLGEAAVRAGRNYVGYDVSPTCCQEIAKRLEALEPPARMSG